MRIVARDAAGMRRQRNECTLIHEGAYLTWDRDHGKGWRSPMGL